MFRHPLLFCLPLLCPISTVAVAAEVWPAFRGPGGDGIVRPAKDLPTEWSRSENIAWRTPIDGSGWSSPVVSGGRVFLTAAIDKDGSGYFLSLLILDLQSGDLLKTVHVMGQPDGAKIHSKNSHASPTPIVDGDRVFVHFGYQGTACLSRKGEVAWINRDLSFKPTHGNGGSPILVNDRLIFTCDGDKEPKVVALNASTGQLAWQTQRPVSAVKTFSFCTPTLIEVDGQKQVIAPGSDCVLALDPDTGETIWDVRYTGYSVIPKPVYHNDLVFISTSFDSSKMIAIRPNGRGIVTNSHIEWVLGRNIPKTPSMIADDGLVYSVSDNGIAQCVEADTGEVVYKERIGGNFSASPLMNGNLIYFTSEQGRTTVARKGRRFREVAKNDLGERTLASLAVAGDSLLIRTAEALYRVAQ